jgi:hypothetical protein
MDDCISAPSIMSVLEWSCAKECDPTSHRSGGPKKWGNVGPYIQQESCTHPAMESRNIFSPIHCSNGNEYRGPLHHDLRSARSPGSPPTKDRRRRCLKLNLIPRRRIRRIRVRSESPSGITYGGDVGQMLTYPLESDPMLSEFSCRLLGTHAWSISRSVHSIPSQLD